MVKSSMLSMMALAAALSLLALAAPANAVAIPVPDAGFEDHVLTVGGYVYVGDTTISAWNSNYGAGGGAWIAYNYYDGQWPARTGNNLVYGYDDYIYQILDEKFIEGATYKLSAWIGTLWGAPGYRDGWWLYFTGEDWTNNLIETSGNSPIGNYQQFSVEYTPTAADVGKQIGIKMYGEQYVAFDDVTLSYYFKPHPLDGATDVCRSVVLRWTPPEYVPPTNGHKVYFSEDFNDVNDGLAGADRGLTTDPEFDTGDLPFDLDFETTYYWRIDEANTVTGWDRGIVWQFTTEPFAYPVDGDGITATASSSEADKGPENTLNLDGDLHSKDTSTMWLSDEASTSDPWIQYEFDKIYKLHEMWIWNYNGETLNTAFGLRDVTIKYSTNGTDFTTLGSTHEFPRAPGTDGYAHETPIALDGAAAKYLRITANSSWGGDMVDQYGLSEVRFFYLPVRARKPDPENEATGVPLDTVLTWRAGRQAGTHDVYISTDEQAVADGTVSPYSIPAGGTCQTSYGPLSLELGKTYYWRVNEVNMAEEPNTWEGDVWSFSTPEYVVVEDFEDYNDTTGFEVFSTWLDGWQKDENGSQIGYFPFPPDNPHYLEQTIVHGGSWSAPLHYDNTDTVVNVVNSEVTRTYSSPQDWTVGGIRALTLFFYGQADNTTPSAGEQMYVKLNGVKVAYDGDMADITREQWHQWDIDLASFGVNLSSITTISIGFDRGASPVSGLVYFDDIRLYSSKCLPLRRKPAGDLNNDCRFDPWDLQILTNNWLISTYEIDPQDPGTANLIGHWPLDEGTGMTTADVAPAGYANHGDLVDGAAWTTGYDGGNAISFDGVDDYVVCAERLGDSPGTYPAELMPSTFTVSCWANLDAFSYFSSFVGNGMDYGANECGFFLYNFGWEDENGQDFGLAIRTETGMSYVETPNIYETGTWYHISATYDGQYATFYVDGAVAGGPLDVGGPMRWINDQDGNYPERFAIGVWLDPGYELWVDGTIDEVRYYSRALSDGEVGWLAGERTPYVLPLHLLLTPANPEINAYDGDAIPIIDFKDFAALAADGWLDYQLWP